MAESIKKAQKGKAKKSEEKKEQDQTCKRAKPMDWVIFPEGFLPLIQVLIVKFRRERTVNNKILGRWI